mgnify:CR=1 FL=1
MIIKIVKEEANKIKRNRFFIIANRIAGTIVLLIFIYPLFLVFFEFFSPSKEKTTQRCKDLIAHHKELKQRGFQNTAQEMKRSDPECFY